MNVFERLLTPFDFIFYIVFCFYYNKGRIDKKNYPPLGKAYFLMVIFFVGLSMALYIVLHSKISNEPLLIDKPMSIIFSVSSMLFVYVLYVLNRRYVKIYNGFMRLTFANSKHGKGLGWFLYFLGLASPILLAYIRFKLRY